jgi:prepilin-type N-terminal cleavage/methylation domain-containing protein
MKKPLKTRSAFSLIELSIVILIISIIVSGTLSISSSNIINEKTKLTNERIQEIYKAIGKYVLINHRLPCPASLEIPKTSGNYGVEQRTSNDLCNYAGNMGGVGVMSPSSLGFGYDNSFAMGMIPVNTLGLPSEFSEDGFESKLLYVINLHFAKSDGYPNSNPCLSGDIYYPTETSSGAFPYKCRTSAGVSKDANPGFGYYKNSFGKTMTFLDVRSDFRVSDVVVSLISNGANKFGAFNAASGLQNQVGGGEYQKKNYWVNVCHPGECGGFGMAVGEAFMMISRDTLDETFDDITFYKTRNDIVNDFSAMFLIPCTASSAGSGYSKDVYYGEVLYKSSSCVSPSGSKPYRKCEAFGVWSNEAGCSTY